MRAFALSGAARMLGRYSRRLVRSSSGLCLVIPEGARRRGSIDLGRAAQRVWLALTLAGALAGLGAALAGLLGATDWEWRSAVSPGGEPFHLRVDAVNPIRSNTGDLPQREVAC